MTIFPVYKTNHGIDGWDARTTLDANFGTREKALEYLAVLGYDFFQSGSYYHRDVEKRNTMGAISYQILEQKLEKRQMLSMEEERDIERAAKARPIDSLPSAANAALDALNAAREFILLREQQSPLSELVVKEIESARTLLVNAGAKFLR